MIDSICKLKGLKMPWDDIAAALGPKFTAGAIIQHLAKLRQKFLQADRDAKKAGLDPPAARVFELDRSRKRWPEDDESDVTPAKLRKLQAADVGHATANNLSDDEDEEEWTIKKAGKGRAKAQRTKSSRSKATKQPTRQHTPASRITRGVIKDYSKLGDIDEDDEETKVGVKDETMSELSDASEQSSDATIDEDMDNDEEFSPRKISATPTGGDRPSLIVKLPVRFTERNAEMPQGNTPNNSGMLPPSTFGNQTTQPQFINPFDFPMQMNGQGSAMAQGFYPQNLPSIFNSFGNQGQSYFQGPAMPSLNNMMTPHQSMSSNSTTQPFTNNAHFGGLGSLSSNTTDWLPELGDNVLPMNFFDEAMFAPENPGDDDESNLFGGKYYRSNVLFPD